MVLRYFQIKNSESSRANNLFSEQTFSLTKFLKKSMSNKQIKDICRSLFPPNVVSNNVVPTMLFAKN